MRRPIAVLVTIAVLMLLTGCASSKILKQEELAQLRGAQEIHVVQGQPASLSILTPAKTTAGVVGGVLGGPLGGAIVGAVVEASARADGKKLMADYALDDPAGLVKERVVTALVEQQAVPTKVRTTDPPVEDIGADALAKLFPGATILAFRTDHWKIIHFGSDYGVIYGASARLVRTTDATELWKVACHLDGKDFPKLSMAELKADNGALLKTRLQKSAELCAEKLVQQMTGSTVSAAAKP
jgi:outer membrane lipoprotein SlyB